MKKIKFLNILVLFICLMCFVGCDINLDSFMNSGNNQTNQNDNNDNQNGDIDDNQDNNHQKNTVNFFTMNDIHGRLITDSDAGTAAGLDKVSTILKELEAKDEYIKISNGDMFQGSQFSNTLYGRPAIEWMNLEHFDCFVLGNHEFDWGIDKIASYKDGNLENGELNEDCEILGCNIYLKSTNAMPSWLQAYSIEECNGYKVGVIGCIGEGLTSSISASMVADYVFVDPVPLVKEYAKILRVEEKCDVVIVSIHDYNTKTQNSRFASLSGDSRIDVIICGHSHTQNADYLTRSDKYDIPVIQCRGYNSSVGSISITMNNGAPVSHGKISHYVPANYQSNKEAYNLLYEYYKDVKDADTKVGYTTTNLSKETLGMLVCDAIMNKYNAEVGICNVGGIRSAIGAGDITYSDIYTVLPFDNTVFIIKIKGSDLKKAINSSLYVNIDNISNAKTYTVAIISYVYENYEAFNTKALEATDTTDIVRDVVAEEIAKRYPAR